CEQERGCYVLPGAGISSVLHTPRTSPFFQGLVPRHRCFATVDGVDPHIVLCPMTMKITSVGAEVLLEVGPVHIIPRETRNALGHAECAFGVEWRFFVTGLRGFTTYSRRLEAETRVLPALARSSLNRAMTSRAFSNASSKVSACVKTSGLDGEVTMYPPSS